MLRVRLLGELQAEVDGTAVSMPASRRAWALLAWLALHPGEHGRGAVAARFWPDVLDSSARASLRSALWELRRALGDEDALVAGRDRIALRCETDLAAFDAHVAAGQLEAAVALHRGPLLADLDDDWVLEARDEHAERLGSALARLAAAAESPAGAVGWARRRLALDPLDEDAARDLMRRLAAAGDRPGALATYDRLSDRLRAALGLAASGETRRLAAAIREEGAADAEPTVAAEAPPAAVAGTPASAAGGLALEGPALVGRDDDLAELVELWDAVRAGSGGVAVIAGEPGIGKTRLALELLTRARGAGARTARCAAADLGGAPPFAPWVELLAGLARQLEPPPAEAQWPEELARLAPSLPLRLGRPRVAPPEVPPDLARARLFEAAVELAEHATADRPLVLLFDDVHLADAPTLELAAYLARRIEDLPMLLVLTRRTIPRRDAVDALAHAARGRGVAVREIALEPLSRRELEALVGEVAALATAQRERVVAAADGNPLLALESARAAARGDEGPPASLRGAVRAAIAGLDEPARRTAELAAVAGRALDRVELAALAPPEAVVAAMDCGLFRSADGRFGFRHDLLREAALADLDDARRALLHEALASAPGVRAAEAARHLRLAGRHDLAVERLVEAAADATRATALVEAVAYLEEAIGLRPDDARIRVQLAGTLAQLGRSEPAMTQVDAALRLLGPDDAETRVQTHLSASLWFRSALCDPTRALRSAQAGLDAYDAGRLDDRELRGEMLLIRAWSEVVVAGAGAADATLAELDALGLDESAPSLRRHYLGTIVGFNALAEGRLEEAEEVLAASGEAGERAQRADLAYGGWSNAACVASAAGRHERAYELARRGQESARGIPTVEFQMSGMVAYTLARLGRHDEARAASDRQAELAERLASPQLALLAAHDGGLLALMAGDYERAAELLGRALDGDPPVQRAEARLRRAEALARLGRADEADAEIRAAALEPMRAAHRPGVLVARMAFAQALSARARGDEGLAERRLREAERQWRRLAGEDDTSREHLASLVDLGRPPVTGVVDPAGELARVAEELHAHV
jgi:DNA-binding SARP family transcriptional activator/tetratricopeptide (TPR) repeat protein